MVEAIISAVSDPRIVVTLLAFIAAAATVMSLAMPLLAGDSLEKRMRTVAIERNKLRAKERERLAKERDRSSVRMQPKAYMRNVVERFNLARHLGTESAKTKLTMAGYRGQSPMVVFLFFRLVTPIFLFLAATIYLFVIAREQQSAILNIGIAIGALYVGIKLPELYLTNQIQKRQLSVKRAFPDALDLMLICVESGMSIEAAFKRVSVEIGTQSIPLAEELTLTSAEMSYLQDRRQAYENLGTRTGLENVRAVCAALIQAEKFGTPVGQAMRVLAQDNRDMRMAEAEKKAAGLPPKLTVPMILFFLPVLFIVILGPAAIQVMEIR